MGSTDLDWNLKRATEVGNHHFIDHVADLRWRLNRAAQNDDWREYNEAARGLNSLGASIQPMAIPVKYHEGESIQMGMFDKPQYLTGKENAFVQAGDTFWLHNARLDGQSNTPNGPRDQAKLLVSHERDGEKVVVYTAGAGIVNQVKRMDAADRAVMPLEVRLDQVPSGKGSPTNVITPADQEPPSGSAGFGDSSNASDF